MNKLTVGSLCCCCVLVLFVVAASWACNEHVCASLVSKCLLLKSCECDMSDKKNCTCCRHCHKCLARLYTDCCSCVGMCPDYSEEADWMKSSTVEELRDPLPELFNVLTEEEDPYLRWLTFNYPAHLDLLYFKPRDPDNMGEELIDLVGGSIDLNEKEEHRVRHGGHHIVLDPDSKVMNCTVAYMTPCMSLGKCRSSCASMGAARYRWFHEHGCCECIGSTCLDYGKGEPHCYSCPAMEHVEEEEETEDMEEQEEYYYYHEYHEGNEVQDGKMEGGEKRVDVDVELENSESLVTEKKEGVFEENDRHKDESDVIFHEEREEIDVNGIIEETIENSESVLKD